MSADDLSSILADLREERAPKDDGQTQLESYRDDLARRARDYGLESSFHADRPWAEDAFAWIEDLQEGTQFTADNVRDEFGTSAAMGSVFRRASVEGLIEVVGIATSTAVTRHRGITRLWRRRTS